MKSTRIRLRATALAAKKSGSTRTHQPVLPRFGDHRSILARFSPTSIGIVAVQLGIQAASMARRIGVSSTTFHRKLKENMLLTKHESDALARHEALLRLAMIAFDGDKEAARRWITTPQAGLGDQVPLDLAQTTFGFREAEKLLVRIDHGVYA